jgi:hypothetical protein
MTDNLSPFQVLELFAVKYSECSLLEKEESSELLIQRPGLKLTVTLPREVPEFYVDASALDSKLKATDWYDYLGYDSTSAKSATDAMSDDLRQLLERFVLSTLRLRALNEKQTQAALDCEIDGTWKQIVPFDA